MPSDALTPEEFDKALHSGEWGLPSTFLSCKASPKKVDAALLVMEWGEIDAERVKAAQEYVESGEPMGVAPMDRKKMRHTHHRLAQLLAGGMSEGQAGALCGYTVYTVCILKNDPAFIELLNHYTATKEEAFADFVDAAAALSMDMLDRLREVLEEEPEKLSPSILLESIKTLADRSGNAPVTRSTSTVNVNLNMGEKLRLARLRAQEAEVARITSVEDA